MSSTLAAHHPGSDAADATDSAASGAGAETRGPSFGAVWDGRGVDFRVAAGQAERVTLCLFERPEDVHACRRVDLERCDATVGGVEGAWHRRLDDVDPGQLYGYRVDGPWAPRRGLFHNPSKLLIEPWARAVTGEPAADPSLFPARGPGGFDGRDSAGAMPKCVVVDPSFDWQGVAPPRVPWRDTVIYELHVAGMTRRHPEIEPAIRGTYQALTEPPVLEHLKALGVTTLELMPVHQAAPEAHLLAQGKRNYWGYAPVAFFAPTAAYASGGRGQQVREFQVMVRELHRAGFEVIVDVVYNHTAEGDASGPLYGPKAFDARRFYRWSRRRMLDITGCGNTLDIRSPLVLGLVLGSLRYWVEVLGVDGFRLDLATVLGRDGGAGGEDFDPRGRLFAAIESDPVLSRCKWIAEPWDLGPDGYRLGAFPSPWAEWNDRFRDAARRFWRGGETGGLSSELASRLAGSRDVFGLRAPHASVNYVVAHDGFTLADLVSYEAKHNLANGEHNRDGREQNFSSNWGREGPTDDAEIRHRRDRARRNLVATLLLARGVPMLSHGDELGRSQGGNNNAYCQDNELAWLDWSSSDPEFLAFLRRLGELRRRFPALRGGRPRDQDPLVLGADGDALGEPGRQPEDLRSFALHLPADGLLLAINGEDRRLDFRLPAASWRQLLATATGCLGERSVEDNLLTVEPLSLCLLLRRP